RDPGGFLFGGALGAHFLKFARLALLAGLEGAFRLDGLDGGLGLELLEEGFPGVGLGGQTLGEVREFGLSHRAFSVWSRIASENPEGGSSLPPQPGISASVKNWAISILALSALSD